MKRNLNSTFLLLLTTGVGINTIAIADPLPFEVATVKFQSYPEYQTFDASIEAIRRATVSSETSGRISEINFDVDDVVKEGSVLVRITDAATRARLSGVEANVSEADAQHNIALAEFTRIQEVYNKQLVSKSAYDKAEAELKAATQRLSAARAKVKEVLEQLKYTVVKAPFSGVVAEKYVELGEMAKVGQPLMTGYAQNEMRAVTHVPQSDVTLIRKARDASILIKGKEQEPLQSSLINVYPEADPDTHTYKVRIKLPFVPEGIYPGHMVKVRFNIGEQQKMRVPVDAVVQRTEIQAVYVVAKNNLVQLRQVRLGKHNSDNTVDILAGLQDGESIALDPIRAGVYLKEQAKN